jgi:hypothetical protein
LIDTPRFNDIYRSDVDILKEISTSLAITYREDIKLTSVIYMQSVLNPKVQRSGLRNLEIFNKLYREDPLKQVFLITSFWDEIELNEGVAREAQFRDIFWKGMTSTVSHMNRFYNTRESALNILEVLARQRPFVLQIQSEVVDDRREIIDTVAGRFLDEELSDLLRDFTEKLTTL